MLVAFDNPSFSDRDTVNGIAETTATSSTKRGLWLYCSVTVYRHAMSTGGEAACHWQPRFGGRRITRGYKGILRRFAGLNFKIII
jgi:hypothetical protein